LTLRYVQTTHTKLFIHFASDSVELSYKQRKAERRSGMKARNETHSSAVTAPGNITDTWETYGAAIATVLAVW
jgi:hypothetical protein